MCVQGSVGYLKPGFPGYVRGIGFIKDSLTAKGSLCEFTSNSLISLAVRLFLWQFEGVKALAFYKILSELIV